MSCDEEVTESGLKNGITQKFKLLIISTGSRGCAGGGVSQRTGQEFRIFKRVAEGGEFHEERFLLERGWKRSTVAASRSSSTWV